MKVSVHNSRGRTHVIGRSDGAAATAASSSDADVPTGTDVPICLAQGLAALLRERGVSVDRWLRAAELPAERLTQATARIEAATYRKLFRLSCASLPQLKSGLWFGYRAPLQTLGILSDVLQHCATLRMAIESYQRLGVFGSSAPRLTLVEDGATAALRCEESTSPTRFGVEASLTFAVRIGRRRDPSWRPHELKFAHAHRNRDAQLDFRAGCSPRFSADRSELVFDRASLDLPRADFDARLFEWLHELATRRDDGARDRSLRGRTMEILRERGDLSRVDLESVAQSLGLTVRCMRRRLQNEGVTLTALTKVVRYERAVHGLCDLSRPIKAVAEQVGFSECSAFHRAFKRWTGVAPAQYRRELANEASCYRRSPRR
jgi:AraC-like DNA-binding protein